VTQLLSAPEHPLPAIDVEVAIDWVQKKHGIVLADTQKEAVRQVCRRQLMIITGGPGVGKTTLIRSIIEIFEAKGLRTVLTAPTGRAAKRLSETTGRPAMTVHRRLEFDPARGTPRRDAQNPLEGDLFVLDETSMADIVLAFQFLRAVPRGACAILVGDVDQLPSVGPGSVLADLIRSQCVPVVRLTEIFRQAAESRIVTAAADIRLGRLPQADDGDPKRDFFIVPAETPEATVDLIVRMVCERIPQRFGWNPRTDIQVLTPMNRHELGTQNLNRVLQEALNPARGQEEIQSFGHPLRVGDRVIQLSNNYSRDVFNGDLGVVQSINRVEQQLSVSFDGRPVDYDFADLDEISLAYALSVHKSQGSEYPCVIIPLATQHFILLRRNLLYTAVTRGKKLVVVVGSKRALSLAVKRQDTTSRYSALRDRLVEAAGGIRLV
jgi:exodeoxyribonuclease V alpha subunit